MQGSFKTYKNLKEKSQTVLKISWSLFNNPQEFFVLKKASGTFPRFFQKLSNKILEEKPPKTLETRWSHFLNDECWMLQTSEESFKLKKSLENHQDNYKPFQQSKQTPKAFKILLHFWKKTPKAPKIPWSPSIFEIKKSSGRVPRFLQIRKSIRKISRVLLKPSKKILKKNFYRL